MHNHDYDAYKNCWSIDTLIKQSGINKLNCIYMKLKHVYTVCIMYSKELIMRAV